MAGPSREPVPRLRTYGGPAVFGYGFRPFFFLAALWAAVAMCAWIAMLAGVFELPTRFAPITWHVHEMLYGFGVAAVAGFLLTAVPSWTGAPAMRGLPLAALALLWCAGRIAVAFSALTGALVAGLIDLAFLVALLLVVLREIVSGANWRNLPMVTGLATLLVGNALMHAEAYGVAVPVGLGWRLGIAALVLLIVLIGGRIVPSFTRNWLVKQGEKTLPPPLGPFDAGTMATSVAALVGWVCFSGPLVAALLLTAAVLNGVRLVRWGGWRTVPEPLVAILHVGYAWVAVGLFLLALVEGTTWLAESPAVHAFTAGAMGTMILAVTTRATLGHTGRMLHAGAGTVGIYALVTVATVARLAVMVWPAAYDALLWSSGLAWIGAFVGYLALYGPMLLSPRPDGRPG